MASSEWLELKRRIVARHVGQLVIITAPALAAAWWCCVYDGYYGDEYVGYTLAAVLVVFSVALWWIWLDARRPSEPMEKP